jgi:PIN domain nuclease of toxin-antitoxin system
VSDSFVTDTHPLVFYAADAVNRLGRKARKAFDAFEAGQATLYVPAPVVLETWMLARAGKVKLRTTLGAWWRDLESAGLVYEPLNGSDVIAASELDWAHNDLFDRLIVSTARRLELPLITADGAITEWGGVGVHW